MYENYKSIVITIYWIILNNFYRFVLGLGLYKKTNIMNWLKIAKKMPQYTVRQLHEIYKWHQNIVSFSQLVAINAYFSN